MGDILKGSGEFSGGFVAHGGSDIGNGSVGFAQELHGLAHAVFLHIGGDGLAVNSLEYGLQGRGIDQIFPGQRFDGEALSRILYQAVMNGADQLGLAAAVAGDPLCTFSRKYASRSDSGREYRGEKIRSVSGQEGRASDFDGTQKLS